MSAEPRAALSGGFQCEDFSSGGDEHLLHVLDSDAKSPAGDARDDLIFLLAVRHVGGAKRAEVLDAGDLIAGRAVVLGEIAELDRMSESKAKNGFHTFIWQLWARLGHDSGELELGDVELERRNCSPVRP